MSGKVVSFVNIKNHTCEFEYKESTGEFVCKICGHALTNEDKKQALAKGNFLLKLDEVLGEDGRKALDILLANTICRHPISGCDACPRRTPDGSNNCKAPTTKEMEWAVEFFT